MTRAAARVDNLVHDKKFMATLSTTMIKKERWSETNNKVSDDWFGSSSRRESIVVYDVLGTI